MIIFTSIVVTILLCGTSLISLVYVWKRKDFRSVLVQVVVIVLSLAASLYGIIQYPAIYSIAKALNFLSPLK